jgi:DNA-binding XRE family transcriptional regulator
MLKVDNDKTARKLKALRVAAGETVDELAKKLGVSHVSVTFYENGKRRPSDDIKVKYAKHYNKSIAFLFYEGE